MLQGNRENNLVNTIVQASPQDAQLAKLLENTIENAQIYLSAKKRQRGCDEMGELAMVKDELSYSIDRIIQYCQLKEYLSNDITYDIDAISCELNNLQKRAKKFILMIFAYLELEIHSSKFFKGPIN